MMGLGIVVLLAALAFCLTIIVLIWKMLSKDSIRYDMEYLWPQHKVEKHRQASGEFH